MKKNSNLFGQQSSRIIMKKKIIIIKKKKQKRPNELKLGLKKITNFTSQSINKVYKNFKKKKKLKKKTS